MASVGSGQCVAERRNRDGDAATVGPESSGGVVTVSTGSLPCLLTVRTERRAHLLELGDMFRMNSVTMMRCMSMCVRYVVDESICG